MHPWQATPLRDNVRFFSRQLLQPLAYGGTVTAKVLGQSHVSGVVPSFTFKKSSVKVRKLVVLVAEMLPQQVESFTASGLDQAGNEQAINRSLRFLGPDQFVELAPVRARLKAPKRDSTTCQKVHDHPVMLQLFLDNQRHLTSQFEILHVRIHQIERCRGCFPFTMRVINQDLMEAAFDLSKPTLGRFGVQVQHEAALEVAVCQRTLDRIRDFGQPPVARSQPERNNRGIAANVFAEIGHFWERYEMVFWRSKSKEAPPEPVETHPSSHSPDGLPSDSSGGEAPVPISEDGTDGEPRGILARFKNGLQKTRQVLNTDIRDLFKAQGRLVDETLLDELFAKLVRTDMGVGPATKIRDQIATQCRGRIVQFEEVLESIAAQTEAMLAQESTDLRMAESGPTVILVVGVNGSGKTTSIGKLANHLRQSGRRVVLGAGDTFRAAAVEQLTVWSKRIGCEIVTGAAESDPASIAFRTVETAVDGNFDVAIIDTAGRLQTQTHLMQQLDKIRRVVGKKIEGAPHEVLLVLDATAGQNAISQARGFSETAGCTGIILAKLDGSARGGVILPIREQFGLPVKFVGLGEGIGDLARFDAKNFAGALFRD